MTTTNRTAIDPVRTHIRTLLNQQMRFNDIAADAGITRTWLSRILYAPTIRTIAQPVADAITNVTPRPAPARHIDAVGTHRRIQALMRAGWSQRVIAGHACCGHSNINEWLSHPRISRPTAATVAAVYERLHLEDGPSVWVAAYAERRGWQPPEAWSDETLDDPDAQPYDWCVDDVDDVKIARVDRGLMPWKALTRAEKLALLRARLGIEPLSRLADRWHTSNWTLDQWTALLNEQQEIAA
jgi:hypothetical protein